MLGRFDFDAYELIHVGVWNWDCKCRLRLPRGPAAGVWTTASFPSVSWVCTVNSERVLRNIWLTGRPCQQTKQQNYKSQNCCAGMEPCRRSTKNLISLPSGQVNATPSLANTGLQMALWQLLPSSGGSCDACYGLLRLQLFFLEEDLSVHGVGTGGRGLAPGGGRGLRPGPDQLQLGVGQALLLHRTRLEESTSAFREAKKRSYGVQNSSQLLMKSV